MLSLEFELCGWKGARPIHLIAGDKARLARLANVCSEEIAIIDREILHASIPFPKKIQKTLVDGPLKIRQLQSRYTEDAAPVTADVSAQDVSHSGAASLGRSHIDLQPLKRAAQLLSIGRAVVATARPGPIVIVGAGRRARALAVFLRMLGRDSILCESTYGQASDWIVAGVLRRPVEGSFLGWLSTDASARLESAGALVLLDPDGAAGDLAALAGLEQHAPPIIAPAADAQGAANSVPLGQGYVAIRPGTPLFAAPSGGKGDLPKITIVTVSFNQAQYLEATLRSVLDQNYPSLEYIVVDGGSTDGSIEIIEKYRQHLAHVIIEPDNGQSDALNKGFRLATGEVMNWLCSDDMIEPGTLARVGAIYRQCQADVIAGGCVRIRETRADELFRHHSALPFDRVMPLPFDDMIQFMRSWQMGHYFFQPEVFFSRRIWEASGAFIKPHLYYAMDYDLWLRMGMAGATVMHVPDMFGCSRVHESQKTRNDKVYLHQVRQIMEQYRDLFGQVLEVADHRGVSASA